MSSQFNESDTSTNSTEKYPVYSTSLASCTWLYAKIPVVDIWWPPGTGKKFMADPSRHMRRQTDIDL